MEWEIKDSFVDDEIKAIEEGLNLFNSKIAERNFKPLVITIKDKGKIIGGVECSSAWNWLHVRLLWVAEDKRHKGLGTELLSKVETEAKNRGCVGVHLDTFEYQAPHFYQKLGYKIFGQIEDYPKGYKRIYLKKEFEKSIP